MQLPSLTVRGSSVLAAGLATGFGGLLLGEVNLLSVGVIAIAVVALCWIWLAIVQVKIRTMHRLEQHEASVGTSVAVIIDVDTQARLSAPPLFCVDQTTARESANPYFLIPGRRAQQRSLRYDYRVTARGWQQLGPLSAEVADLLGLCTIQIVGTESAELLGLPFVEPVALNGVVHHGGVGDRFSQTSLAQSTDYDVILRDHQPTDGLRRVHWRTSARLGKLVVRQDEQHRARAATIVIDDRRRSHNRVSFEQVLSMGASVGVRLCQLGFELTVVTSAGILQRPDTGWTSTGLLRALALIDLTSASVLTLTMGASSGTCFLFTHDEAEVPFTAPAGPLDTDAIAILATIGQPREAQGKRFAAHGWSPHCVSNEQSLSAVLDRVSA